MDLARLGLGVETDQLSVAERKLRKLPAAAGAAEKSARSLQNAFTGLNSTTGKMAVDGGGFAILASGANTAKRGTDAFNKSSLMTSTALTSVRGNLAAVNASFAQFDAVTNNAERSVKQLNNALHQATGSTQRLAAANTQVGQTVGALRANQTNLMAQFQDIGVTAAMGMSPMLIALQQGTQIALVMSSAIGGQGLLGGLKQLGMGFLSMLGPITLFSIGLTAIVAVGFQMIDWIGLARSGLNFLADNLQLITNTALIAAGALALFYAPAILGGIARLTVAIGVGLVNALQAVIWRMVALAVMNPWGFFIVGLGIVTAALFVFRDTFTKIFGVDIIESSKNAINWLIGGFVGAYNGIKAAWGQLPAALGDIAIRAVNAALKAIFKLVTESTMMLNPILAIAGKGLIALFGGIPQLDNQFAGAEQGFNNIVNGAIEAAQSVDYLGNAYNWLTEQVRKGQGLLRGFADTLGVDSDKDKDKKTKTPRTRQQRDPWADMIRDTELRIADLRAEQAMIGLVGEELYRAQAAQDLLNQAVRAGIELTPTVVKQLKEWSDTIGELQNRNASMAFITDSVNAMAEEADMLDAESMAMRMGTVEAARFLAQKELLNAELYRGMKFTDDEAASYIRMAEGIAIAREENQKFADQLKLERDTFNGFFNDMREGLLSGQSVWKTFADSVLGALTRIADKLWDTWLSDAFQGLTSSGAQAGGGGVWGFVTSTIGSLFGSKNAKGNVFGSDIITGPTAFGYGNGKMGLMGEAGEEAVMPLARGPDGSLGVQMHGGVASSQGQTVTLVVRAEEGDMFRPTVEAIADNSAVNVVTVGLTEFNEQLPDRVQEINSDPRAR